MPPTTVPILQIIRSYCVNLPAFPPASESERRVHRWWMDFYATFRDIAGEQGISPDEQPDQLERIQKVLWTFARQGVPGEDALTLSGPALQSALKFSRPESTLRLLAACGAPVQLDSGVKASQSGRLSFQGQPGLAAAFADLAQAALKRDGKEKPAFERFLRANSQAVLAREKPPLDLIADSPLILSVLPSGPGITWRVLANKLKEFTDYQPVVEFRSIHHGMWVINYNGRRGGGRDLCGLIAQDGTMQVRAILYEQNHFYVRDHLADFSLAVQAAFRAAHYYEDFKHQWLFINCQRADEIPGILQVLRLVAESQ